MVLAGPEAHPICANLDPVHFDFVSSIDPVNQIDGRESKVLLESSARSVLYNAPVRVASGVVNLLEEDEGALLPNVSSVCTEKALYGKFCDWVLQPEVDLMEVLCQPSDR